MTREQEIEKIESTLVERYMQRNGWEFPSDKMGCEDYDTAVQDVKWFMKNMSSLGYPAELKVLNDEKIQIERYKVENDLYKHTDYEVTEWDRVIAQAQVDDIIRQLEQKAQEGE